MRVPLEMSGIIVPTVSVVQYAAEIHPMQPGGVVTATCVL